MDDVRTLLLHVTYKHTLLSSRTLVRSNGSVLVSELAQRAFATDWLFFAKSLDDGGRPCSCFSLCFLYFLFRLLFWDCATTRNFPRNHNCTRVHHNMKRVLLIASVSATAAVPDGWTTCGGLDPALNRTACPSATASCCKQNWAPGDGNWGCIDFVNATCCSNGYTACPSGTTCKDTGSSWAVVTECVPTTNHQNVHDDSSPLLHKARGSSKEGAGGGVVVPTPTAGKQVCKQGAPLPFSPTLSNVLILGDSVSIGYTPYVADILADVALVQHTPWGGDGGAEETAYGDQCLDYLLRAPDGTPLRPDVLYFNFGLHNTGNNTIPGQAGPAAEYAPHLENIVKKLRAWAGPADGADGSSSSVKLLFALTSPMLNNVATDDVVLNNNKDAAAIMAEYGIPTIDLHAPIIEKCGPVPQTTCFNETNCW